MRVRTSAGYESRAFSPGGGYTWNEGLWMTGVVPPHGVSDLVRGGVEISERTVTQTMPVNRSISILASNMLVMGDPQPWTLAYDATGHAYHQPVAPIPPLLLNTWGNKLQSEGMVELIYSLALFGEAFLRTLTRDEMGDPTCLDILPAPFVEKKIVAGKPTYTFQVGSHVAPLDPVDITHIRMRARPGHLRGASAMQEQALGLSMYIAAIQYGLQFFGQGIHSSFVLTSDNKLTQDVIDRVLAKLIVEHSGLNMAHLPMVFGDGLKPQKMQITPDEAQFLGTLEFAANTTGAYFGIPPTWIGGTMSTGAMGRTMEEQMTWFAQNTLALYYTPIQEGLSVLLPLGQACSYNVRKLSRGDSANFARELLAIRTGTIMIPDEIRRDFYDQGPLPDGEGASANAPLASNQSPTATMGIDSSSSSTN